MSYYRLNLTPQTSCDNHCNAFTCHDLNGVTLHRDETAGDTGDDDRRRAAIGCGSNNYCPSGTDCDEFPYASTFDGGLGVMSKIDSVNAQLTQLVVLS